MFSLKVSQSVQSLSPVRLFATPWTAAHQASLSITNSWSPPKLTSIESVMSSSHLILCRPLLLLPPIPPSIRVFSNESTLRMRWPKYWSFSFSISLKARKDQIMPFAATWTRLEIMILSEVSHKDKHYLIYMWNWKYDTNEPIWEIETIMKIENKVVIAKGEGIREGRKWEAGVGRRKLSCIAWIHNRVLVYGTENYL